MDIIVPTENIKIVIYLEMKKKMKTKKGILISRIKKKIVKKY